MTVPLSVGCGAGGDVLEIVFEELRRIAAIRRHAIVRPNPGQPFKIGRPVQPGERLRQRGVAAGDFPRAERHDGVAVIKHQSSNGIWK